LTWTKYEESIIKIQILKILDKMTWDAIQQWIMVLAAGDRTMFYGSKNLKDFFSDFGRKLELMVVFGNVRFFYA
jgi:levanase/fructan beta-fructosidase